MAKARDKSAKPRRWAIARRIVQALFLLLFCLPLLAAGWGLLGIHASGDTAVPTPAEGAFYGSLASSNVAGVNLLDPFAALQVGFASKSVALGWVGAALVVAIVYAVIGGRAFCGWVCPVNLLLEGTDWLRRKAGVTVAEHTVSRHAKVWAALAVLVVSAVVSLPVFEALSPVAAVNRGILFGATAGVVTLGAIVLAEFFWSRRVWCRALCPLGGFYEVLGKGGVASVSIDHGTCTRCGACQRACLADPAILEEPIAGRDAIVRAGDCMVCGACVDACPHGALRLSVGKPRPLVARGPGDGSEACLVGQACGQPGQEAGVVRRE